VGFDLKAIGRQMTPEGPVEPSAGGATPTLAIGKLLHERKLPADALFLP
jgi:hypothetical protein